MKQAQYSPVAVEEQVAIIFVSTKGMMDEVPVDKVREFEQNFLDTLKTKHQDVLSILKAGKLEDSATETLASVARDLAKQYV